MLFIISLVKHRTRPLLLSSTRALLLSSREMHTFDLAYARTQTPTGLTPMLHHEGIKQVHPIFKEANERCKELWYLSRRLTDVMKYWDCHNSWGKQVYRHTIPRLVTVYGIRGLELLVDECMSWMLQRQMIGLIKSNTLLRG